ncbi:MAG: kelch repeat-containing protein [Tepidisphaeraceae bacterium]
MYSRLLESLENRRLLAVDVAINFQPSGVSGASGMIADTGGTYATRNGYTYGWDKTNSNARDRNSTKSPTQAYDTFTLFRDTSGSNRTWDISLPNGKYTVRIVAGDPSYDMSPNIKAEGATVLSGTTTSSNRWIDKTATVTVSDGKLTLTNGSSASRTPISFIQIKTAGTTTTTTAGWPGTSAWKAAAGSPINRFESHAFSYNGKLYVMGGWQDSSFNSTKRVDVYDPATNTWTRKKDMSAPETHAGAALDEANGVIYFVGGHRGKYPSTPSKEVWKYTIATDTWTKLSATLPYAMGANACSVVNGKLYSYGGNYADRVTNTGDVFVLDLGNISAGFKKQANKMPTPRDHLSSVTIGKYVYVFGGEIGHDKTHDQQNLLHRYDPETDTWVKLASAPQEKSHAESSAFVLNGKIIWAGGQTNPQAATSSVYQFDPATGKWTTLASLPYKRQGTIVQKVGNYFVFATGGIETNQPQKSTWVVKIA